MLLLILWAVLEAFLISGNASAQNSIQTPLTSGDQLFFFFDARENRVPFLTVTNPAAEPVSVEIAFYPSTLAGRLATVREDIPALGHAIVDPTSDDVDNGVVRGTMGLAIVTPVNPMNEQDAIVPPKPLAGGFTLANLRLQAAFGENALGRLAVTRAGQRAEPGAVIDGSSVRYQRFSPGVLAVPTYFNPMMLAPAGLDGNRVVLVAFEDRYGARFDVGPASRIVGVTLRDARGELAARGLIPVSAVLSTSLQEIAGGPSPLVQSGKAFFDVRGATENVLGIFSQSLGQFASGQRMPGVREVPSRPGDPTPAPTASRGQPTPAVNGSQDIRTLAYVMARCRNDSTIEQEIWVLRPNEVPKMVHRLEPLTVSPFATAFKLCYHLSQTREGASFSHAGGYRRLGVSPDGSLIVFEVGPGSPYISGEVPPDKQGLYSVRADGVDPPTLLTSRVGDIASVLNPDGTGFRANYLSFSPSGTTITLPIVDDSQVTQIAVLDVQSGDLRRLTTLPGRQLPSSDPVPATCCPYFVDENTITFRSSANPNGSNPEGAVRRFSIDTRGQDLEALPALPEELSTLLTSVFAISGPGTNVNMLTVPGTPSNPLPDLGLNFVVEVFLRIRDQDLLQLTALGRSDTNGGILGTDNERVFFIASSNTAENPSQNCQVFSASALGQDVRQLTHFNPRGRSDVGCVPSPFVYGGGACNVPPGCVVGLPRQEPTSSVLVFDSSCNPFSSNMLGNALFTIRPDGSGLREVVRSRGLFLDGDAAVVELIGPWALSGRVF